MVVGYFAEASEVVHHLIQCMVESRVACADLNQRQHGESAREEHSVVVAQIRRLLSLALAGPPLFTVAHDADRGGDKGVTEKEAVEGQRRVHHETGKRSPVAQKNAEPWDQTEREFLHI